jgi:hypothetical protein
MATTRTGFKLNILSGSQFLSEIKAIARNQGASSSSSKTSLQIGKPLILIRF